MCILVGLLILYFCVSDIFLYYIYIVVSQTEIILKDLERILRHVADPSITACDSYVDGKEKDIGEKVWMISVISCN